MLGSFIAGTVVGSLLTSSSKSNSTRTVKVLKPNELIEYHEWLEKRKQKEMESDLKQIDDIYHKKLTHCPECGNKIKFEVKQQQSIDSYSKQYIVHVCCGCRDYVEKVSGDEVEFLQKGEDKVRKIIQKFYKRIVGHVSFDDIRHNYLESKLAKKQEEERYYGKI